MKHLFTIMIIVFVLLWGFSVSSNVQAGNVCPSGNGCPTNNFCCPAGSSCIGPKLVARCGADSSASAELANGACCLDGSFLPGAPCDCNQPPDCSNAAADPDYLWPPNHKIAEVSVIGVTDPDGDTITIEIIDITQDEPVDAEGMGDGKTAPDGMGIGTETASVRAERDGVGNGRVYEISFTAADGNGAECLGTVQVCVPHDQGSGYVCIDDGQAHDSTIEP